MRPLSCLFHNLSTSCRMVFEIDAALVAVLVTALLALAASAAWVGRVVARSIDHRPPPAEPALTTGTILGRNQWRSEIESQMESLTLAVAEGIARVDRAEHRIQKTVSSARRLVANAGLEHAGIEAEGAELRSLDAPDIEPEPLPAVQPEVVATGPSGIPGIPQERLNELRAGRI